MPLALCTLLFAVCTVVSAQSDTAHRGYAEADVRFMQGMIGHHAQALTMAALVPSRTSNADLRLLAEKIDVSQRDEIATMRRWLRARNEALPDSSGHQHQHELMPGMLTEAELEELGAARGPAFDRLFLTFMIRHHEGALTMVERLFSSAGAVQEPEIAGFATDVNADQRAEIRRMQALLAKIP
ncbi:MAG TPA: DUF305 domain-containing protein [Gemmatimonadales bacterium]|nr:DUF305 domain-containing protein [Gemmatimonadales bacterium]